MHSIRISKFITLIISVFYLIGVWHRGNAPTAREIRIKLFYSIYYAIFVVSLAVGAINSDKQDESIFLTEGLVGTVVLAVKLWILIWKQNEILNLLNRVCVFSIRNDDDCNLFNGKLLGFIKFVFVYVTTLTVAGSLLSVVLSLLGSKKNLFLKIGFPFNYENNEIAFWAATIFIFTEIVLSLIIVIFGIIIWYLLLICSLRYEVLGSELKNMGRFSGKDTEKITEKQMQNSFLEDLKSLVDSHQHLRELLNDLGSFFSDIFFVQFGTRGQCICGSICCLAFDMGDNLMERFTFFLIFIYVISELFMITYFGNEIMLSSNRLSYSLFESNWYEQPQSTKKYVIFFGEYLKQPHVLMIGKLYPLTLETFTRILNSAYSMFNVLKSFQ